jgi:hypothetical protein
MEQERASLSREKNEIMTEAKLEKDGEREQNVDDTQKMVSLLTTRY